MANRAGSPRMISSMAPGPSTDAHSPFDVPQIPCFLHVSQRKENLQKNA
jgi:hypothetical protein